MTFVRHFGCPDLFITFTCNPKWIEIEIELLNGQRPTDRHDLLARVFLLKLQKLMDLIKIGQIFGSVKCDMYTIEWQKRSSACPYSLMVVLKNQFKQYRQPYISRTCLIQR
uniref:Helitron helicase-like domain-containing protein n=1 Tax=Octopus bimaculoides TaxID=37653 RepID=A0A0L8FKW3_OCTBM